ncbi:unnamed protein product [Ectocarpus sp. 12 AP-2014]
MQAPQWLTAELQRVGYVRADCDVFSEDQKLSECCFDYICDGFSLRRSENVIPESKRR